MCKTAHITVGVVCLMSTAMLAAVLADGRSMFAYDGSDGTSSGTVKVGSLVGDQYGFGVFYDSNGRTWHETGNLIVKLHCNDHKQRFRLLNAFTLIATVASGCGIIISLIGAAKLGRVYGYLSFACSVLLFVVTLIAMAVGWDLWSETYSCGKLSFTIKDDFTLSYGPIFLTICFVFSLVNSVALVALGAMQNAQPTHEPTDDPVSHKADPEDPRHHPHAPHP